MESSGSDSIDRAIRKVLHEVKPTQELSSAGREKEDARFAAFLDERNDGIILH
jgi:hypothetical protein